MIAPIDANGKISVSSSNAVNFVIDVSGYFTAPSSSLGLGYHSITPSRLVTVASGGSSGPCTGAACGPLVGSTRQRIQVAGNGGVPASASAVVGYLTLSAPSVDGYVRLNPNFATGMGLAGDESINMNNGDIRNSLVLIPLKADGSMEIVSSVAVAEWSLDVSGYLTQPIGTWGYQYGADGTRTAKTSPGGTATAFTYSDGSGLPLLLRQKTGTDLTYVVYGPGGQPVEQVNPDGTALWLHHDQLGSVRLATRASDGTEHSRRRYNAHGTVAAESVVTSGDKQPLLSYAGQYTDTETGFQYLRARYYDPGTGQFLTVDPLVAATHAPYGYAGGSPTAHADPSGLCLEDFCVVELMVVVGMACSEMDCEGLLAMEPEEAALGSELAAAAGDAASEVACPSLGPQVEDEVVEATPASPVQELSNSDLKTVRSLSQRIAEHEAKLDAYLDNPEAYDNDGRLANAPSDEVRQSIIDGSARHLRHEIET